MKALINNSVVIKNAIKADTFMSRLVGLLNKKSIGCDEGLLLLRCNSIHCFFMKFTIDAVYLSKDMEVLYKETVKPWKIGKIVKNCAHVLELNEGAAKNISVGDIVVFSE
jgi:uncharacterized membrane protein (UPF0127 family)